MNQAMLQRQYAIMRRTALPGPVLLVLTAEAVLNHWVVPFAANWLLMPLAVVFSLVFGLAAFRALRAQGTNE